MEIAPTTPSPPPELPVEDKAPQPEEEAERKHSEPAPTDEESATNVDLTA